MLNSLHDLQEKPPELLTVKLGGQTAMEIVYAQFFIKIWGCKGLRGIGLLGVGSLQVEYVLQFKPKGLLCLAGTSSPGLFLGPWIKHQLKGTS